MAETPADRGRSRVLSRRRLLAAGTGLAAALAGCAAASSDSSWDLPDSTDSSMVREMQPGIIGEVSEGAAKIDVFSDLFCPHCARWNRRSLHVLREEVIDPGAAYLVHRDYPLPVDERLSWPAAYAARKVLDTGGSAPMWAFIDAFYRRQDDLSSVGEIATLAGQHATANEGNSEAANTAAKADTARSDGTNADAVREAIDSQTYYPVVDADRREAADRGVEGTPAVFVAGDRIADPSPSAVIEAVENAADR